MRSGTMSTSSKFHTSFCSVTQALNSSRLLHLRMVIRSTPGAVTVNFCPPEFWLAATNSPSRRGSRPQESYLSRATVLPASRSGGGTCGWSCATPTRDPPTGTAQCSPAQKTDHRLHLPGSRAMPPEHCRHPVSNHPAELDVHALPVRGSLREVSRAAPGRQASQSLHAPPWS